MRAILFFLILYFFNSQLLIGQNESVIEMTRDKLRLEAANWDGLDTNRRVDILNELAFRYQNEVNRNDTVWEWVEEAQRLLKTKAEPYLEGEGDAWVRFGILADKKGALTESIDYYRKALIIRRDSLKAFLPAGRVCNNIGILYEKQKDSIEQAIKYYKKGLELFQKAPPSKGKDLSKARLMNNLGDLLGASGDFNQANFYLDSSLFIRELHGNLRGIGDSKYNKAILFKRQGNQELSLELFEQALANYQKISYSVGLGRTYLAIGNYHSIKGDYSDALSNYGKALNYSDQLENFDRASIFQDRAISYLKLKQYRNAELDFEKALEIFTESKDEDGLALLLFNYGSFYFDQAIYQQALEKFQECNRHLGSLGDVSTKVELYNYFAKAFSELNIIDSSAHYIQKYTQLKDTIADTYRDAMNTQYNLAIAENEIQRLNIERAAENQKKMKTFGLIGFGVSWLLLGLAVMGYYLSRQRRRLAEKNIQLAKQEVIELIQEKDLETNYAWMDGVETTRKQIGQELHDSIGSMLSIVKVYFSSLDDKMENIRKDNRDKYDKANNLLDEACDKVRKLSHEMTSAILVKFGLTNQLETLAQTLRDSGQLKVELNTFGLKERLKTQTEFNIYRIIQELVSNVIKHARADKISIQVNRFEDMINIMVEDNGVGFDVEKARQEGGIGLRNVASRVHELEGTLDFDSSPGKGTTVTIDIPVLAEQPVKLEQKPLNT